MIAIIRITGQVNLSAPIVETLHRLRIRKKYACVVFVKPTKEQLGMLKKVRDFVAYGEINKSTFEKLIEARGKIINKDKKLDSKKIKIVKQPFHLQRIHKFWRLHRKPGYI